MATSKSGRTLRMASSKSTTSGFALASTPARYVSSASSLKGGYAPLIDSGI